MSVRSLPFLAITNSHHPPSLRARQDVDPADIGMLLRATQVLVVWETSLVTVASQPALTKYVTGPGVLGESLLSWQQTLPGWQEIFL